MEQTNQNFLVNEKLGVLMRKYTIPRIISLLMGALYNFVSSAVLS